MLAHARTHVSDPLKPGNKDILHFRMEGTNGLCTGQPWDAGPMKSSKGKWATAG